MGYALDNAVSKKLSPLHEVNPNRNVNRDLEARVESEIIAMLQAKCSELAKEAEEDKANKKQAEIEVCMLRSQIANMEKVDYERKRRNIDCFVIGYETFIDNGKR
jgi:hypothetical protein